MHYLLDLLLGEIGLLEGLAELLFVGLGEFGGEALLLEFLGEGLVLLGELFELLGEVLQLLVEGLGLLGVGGFGFELLLHFLEDLVGLAEIAAG